MRTGLLLAILIISGSLIFIACKKIDPLSLQEQRNTSRILCKLTGI